MTYSKKSKEFTCKIKVLANGQLKMTIKASDYDADELMLEKHSNSLLAFKEIEIVNK